MVVLFATSLPNMEQHPVPQNVTTFQFRLIGDMTLKQFGYLAGGAILGYIAYKLPLPFFFTWPLAASLALGGIGFAFVPVEERPMDVWFLSFMKSIYSPTQYLWQKTQVTPPASTEKPPVVAPQSAPVAATVPQPSTRRSSFAGLNLQLDALKKQLLGFGVKKAKPAPAQAPVITGQAAVPMPPRPTAQPAAQSFVPVMPNPAAQGSQPAAPVPTPAPVPVVQPPQPASHPVRQSTGGTSLFAWIAELFKPKPGTAKPHPAPQPVAMPVHMQAPQMPVQAPQPHPVKSHVLTSNSGGVFDWIASFFAPRPKPAPAVIPAYPMAYPNVYQTTNAPSVTGSKPQPVEQAPAAPTPVTPPPNDEAQKKADELQKQLETLRTELQSKTMSESRILELQKQLLEVLDQKSKMEHEIQALRQQLSQPQQPQQYKAAVVSKAEPEKATVKVITPDVAVKAGLPRLTTFPNVVTGIIKDTSGNLLPGVLVTVRDKEDIPVRALKTNKLGQFAASTPLPNGVFTVDIEDPKNTYNFDRVRITLNGTVMSPLEIIAKSKREMDRAKLEREIFGSTSI